MVVDEDHLRTGLDAALRVLDVELGVAEAQDVGAVVLEHGGLAAALLGRGQLETEAVHV